MLSKFNFYITLLMQTRWKASSQFLLRSVDSVAAFCVCVRVCVCVRERESEWERECVSVRVYVAYVYVRVSLQLIKTWPSQTKLLSRTFSFTVSCLSGWCYSEQCLNFVIVSTSCVVFASSRWLAWVSPRM